MTISLLSRGQESKASIFAYRVHYLAYKSHGATHVKPAILIGLFIGLVAFSADARPHSHHTYYRNSSGHLVHSPSSSPTGASAKCRDGSYSYSEHRRGTCSHHGGVARWF